MFRRKPKNRESKDALTEAAKNLSEVKAQHCEVQQVSTSLRRLRESNHFAEQLHFIMGGN